MKRTVLLLLCFLPCITFSQTYSSQWEEVERLVKIKNYAQTQPILSAIKVKARKEKNSPEWVRAVLAEHHALTVNMTEDSAFHTIQRHFESHITQGNTLEKKILQNFYAQFLGTNSTYRVGAANSFLSWSAQEKSHYVDSLFRTSLQDVEILRTEKMENWEAILMNPKNLSITPTLYHFLSYPYLDFMEEQNATREESIEAIQRINTLHHYKDAKSYLIFQPYLTSNIRAIGNHLDTLRSLLGQEPADYESYVHFMIAKYYEETQNKNATENELRTAMEKYPNSPWLEEIKDMYQDITKVEIDIVLHTFSPRNEFIPIKIQTTNVEKLFIRVYNTTNTPKNYKTYTPKLDSLSRTVSLDASLVYEEVVELPKFDDYKERATNYKVNPLAYGNYKILVSNNAEFKDDNYWADVMYGDFVVTDLFISPTIERERILIDEFGYMYKVLLANRMSGLPYKNKPIKLYEETKQGLKLVTATKTNSTGEFRYGSTEIWGKGEIDELLLYIPKEKQLIDLIEFNDIPHHYQDRYDRYDDKEDAKAATTMTDRAIYRPGQRVHFKSIFFHDDFFRGKVLTGNDISVYLHDANGQRIDSLFLRTNVFGSVNGTFSIPEHTLNGTFRISIQRKKRQVSSHSFSVEEYKRPTFKVTFDPNKDTYTKQDTAIFTGFAESFTGVKLSDVTVTYTVDMRHPNHYQNITIQDSTTMTDNEGKFLIKVPFTYGVFKDLNTFNLQVKADVIGESGEIQSANYNYGYSHKPWRIDVEIPTTQTEYKWKSITVNTTNNNNQFLPFSGHVNIYKKNPLRIFMGRTKTFDFEADYHILDTNQYKTYFPNYFDQSFLSETASRTLVKSYSFNTHDTPLVEIDSTLFAYGEYIVEVFAVQNGDTITNVSQTRLLSSSTFRSSDNEFLSVSTDKTNYTPGEKISIQIHSDVPGARGAYLWGIHKGKKKRTRFVPLKNGKGIYSFRAKKKNIFSSLSFETSLLNNNVIDSRHITVPIVVMDDKKLEVSIHTFRNKITPGEKEKWSFAIKQNDSPAFAEVLATMYDSSLDEFRVNGYPDQLVHFPYRYYGGVYPGWTTNAFQTETSLNYVGKINRTYTNIIPVSPPRLNSYGLVKPYYLLRSNHSFTVAMTGSVAYRLGDDNQAIDELVVVGYSLAGAVPGIAIRGTSSIPTPQPPLYVVDGEIVSTLPDPSLIKDMNILKDGSAIAIYGSRAANGVIVITTQEGHALQQLNQVQARTNLQETAFFFPNLLADRDGNVTFEFDSPEALTRWKLMLFAHTKDLKSGTATFFTQTQKKLMIRPNLPRFFREGDEIVIKTQVQNLSDTTQKGTARLEVINPVNNEIISSAFFTDNGLREFSTAAKGNSVVTWALRIPKDYQTVQIKIVGATDEFSDGEIHEIPILPNRLLVTDTEKIILEPGEQKDYVFRSTGKDNLQAKIQVQSNPILEIISALDYLKNYPYECNEQTASKWYSLMMLQYIKKHYPAISEFFNNIDPEETLSKLEENSKLSELLNEEMPWVRQIQNDREKIKSLVRLFKTDIASELRILEQKLQKAQMSGGAFSWFDGGKPDTHISIRLLEVFGKVAKLDQSLLSNDVLSMSQKLVGFLDQDTAIYREKAAAGLVLDYLYVRTLWNDHYVLSAGKTEQLRKHIDLSALYTAKQPAGLAAKAWLVNARYDYRIASIEVKNRIMQEVIYDKERGMYWETNERPYNSISLQSYMVEAYQELDSAKLDQITQWIYYSKQHNNWRTTWNTVDAVYALLLANNPKDFTLHNTVAIQIDRQTVETNDKVLGQVSAELPAEELTADKTVSVTNNNNRKVYGGIYHQYFVPLENVESTQQALSVEKKILVETSGEWVETTSFKSGDKIKIQLIVVNNEPLNYVHLKDSRPAGFEPVYRPSGYQWWQGYYFTIRDASTNYFFDYLPKGRHVYEYEVKTNNNGIFNSGVAQAECMYEPAVNARSENLRVTIGD